MTDGPARRYFLALLGAWSGTLVFRAKRAPALSLAMQTTLAEDGDGFRHTTRVAKWGLAILESEETIDIAAGGRALRMSGTQRVGPRRLRYEATGEVDESASGATYRIPWMGGELLQVTAITDSGLVLTQRTSWSRARVVLRRA